MLLLKNKLDLNYLFDLDLLLSSGEEPVVVAKAGASVTLQCTDDPPGAERVWRIGDTFFNSERKGWIEADDGSLAIQEIGEHRFRSTKMFRVKFFSIFSFPIFSICFGCSKEPSH